MGIVISTRMSWFGKRRNKNTDFYKHVISTLICHLLACHLQTTGETTLANSQVDNLEKLHIRKNVTVVYNVQIYSFLHV